MTRSRAASRRLPSVLQYETLRQFLGRRCGVLRDRYAAERGEDFREHGAVQRNAGHGEARRGRRMRVHDRLHVRPLLVDLEVHQRLG